MKSILVFGDSITWGACDYKHGGWVALLRNYFEERGDTSLGSDGKLVDVAVYNLGVSGNTISDILERFDVEAKARKPGTIILAAGVNDTQRIDGKDRARVSSGEFRSDYSDLIEKALKFTSKVICVGLTPVDESKTTPIPWSPSKSYYNDFIKEYDKIIQEISREKDVSYISVYELVDAGSFEDGLHPGSSGHERIFRTVKRHLEEGV